jgi:hypothetical protein
MAGLLAGSYGPPPVILVGFNHSGRLRDDVSAARAKVAISVDRKPCATKGLHALLDVCDVIDMTVWEEAYFNPPCMFSSWSDTSCMVDKLRDGRFWWGVAKVLACICAPSPKVFVEQPRSHVEEATGIPASQSIDPRDYDDKVKKTLRVWTLGGATVCPPPGLVTTAHEAPVDELVRWHAMPAAGDVDHELRSDWRLLPNVSMAVARCMGGDGLPNPRYVYADLVEAMAERLYDAGVPIMWDYANADARPTSDSDRDYSQTRGKGDGRSSAGIKPARVRARESATAPPIAPGSYASFPLSCRGTSLRYQRPAARQSQPLGDASSSSRISKMAARMYNLKTPPPPTPPSPEPSPAPASSVPDAPAAAFSPLRPARGPSLGAAAPKAHKTIVVPADPVSVEGLSAEAVVLVPVSLHTNPPLALVPERDGMCLASSGAVPGDTPGARRANATCAARSMLAGLLSPPPRSPALAQCHMVGAACIADGPSVYVVAAPISRLCNAASVPRAPSGYRWRTLASIRAKGVFTLVKVALLGVAALADPAVRMAAGVRTGAIPDAAASTGVARQSAHLDIGRHSEFVDAEMRRTVQLFEASADVDPVRADMWRSWVSVFHREPAPPVSALAAARSLSDPRLATLPFSASVINSTRPVRLPAHQPPLPAGVKLPHTPRQTYLPWAQHGMARQAAALTRHHRGVGKRPSTKAWGEDARKPALRGTILDYRAGHGRGKLLDVAAPAVATHLNLEAWRRHFAGHRNRRLFSFVVNGVQYRDELPLQTMMAGNLQSLYETDGGLDAVVDAMHGLASKYGWLHKSSTWQPDIVPLRTPPTGATDRKVALGAAPAEPRPLADQGHPHGPPTQEVVTEGAHDPVVALNPSAGPMRHSRGDTDPKWWTERKPTARHAAVNLAILGHFACLLRTIVLLLAFDFSKFFHQLVLCGSEIWKTGRLLPERLEAGGASPDLVSMVELVLSMGISPASNICQELADALMVRLIFLVNEAGSDLLANWAATVPKFGAVMRARASMDHDDAGTQARLTADVMYTDDSLKAAVGPEGSVLIASCFWRLVGPVHISSDATEVAHGVCHLLGVRHVAASVPRTGGLNFIAAATTKWGGGHSAVWVGVGFSGAWGVAWIIPSKRLRTLDSIDQVLGAGMPVAEYRSLYGFLVSIAFMLDLGPYGLAGLQRPMLDGHELSEGLSTVVRVCADMSSRLRRIARAVADCGAVSVLAAVDTDMLPRHPSPFEWVIGGDAALEDADDPHQGLGSSCWGLQFRVEFSFDPRLRLLPISALEAITAGCAICVFGPMLTHARRVVIASDALATAIFLAGRARSCILATIHECIRATAAWRELNYPVCRLWRRHTWGEVNTLHDGVSRGYDDVVCELNSAVGLETTDVGFEKAKPFITACLDAVDDLHGRWRGAGYVAAPLEPMAIGAAGPSVGAYNARGEVIEFYKLDIPPPRRARLTRVDLVACLGAARRICVRMLWGAILAATALAATAVSAAAALTWRSAFRGASSGLAAFKTAAFPVVRQPVRRVQRSHSWRLPVYYRVFGVLAALSSARALKYGHDESRHPIQWFGPGSVPGDVAPIGDTVIQRAPYGPPRPSYGPRPPGAETLYFQYPPALLPGQPKLKDAELLRELEFADGYMPFAQYVVLISALGAGGVIDDLRWVQSSVANIRRQITGGLFLQHWYISDPWSWCGGSSSKQYVHDPRDPDSDEDYWDPGPPISSECDLCGSAFWPGSAWGSTDDWKGTGMGCCGCQSDSCSSSPLLRPAHNASFGAVAAGVAYDPDIEVIRFVNMSRAERVAASAAPHRSTSRSPRPAARSHARAAHRAVGFRSAMSGGASSSLRRRVASIARRVASIACPVSLHPAAPAYPDAAARIITPELRARVESAGLGRSSAERFSDVSNYVAARVESDVAALQTDESRLALRPSDWGLVRGLLTASNAATERRVPNTTKKQDRCNWRKWDQFCKLVDTPPIRDDIAAATGADPVGYKRECLLVELAFMYWITCEPQFLVTSMLQRLRGVSRIHKVSLRLPFTPLSHLVQVCKGLVQERIDDQGPESLVRKQKEPLQNWMIFKWLTVTQGTVGGIIVGPNVEWQGVRCLITYFASTGARKADVALNASDVFGLRHLALWNATWEIRGEVVIQPTAEQLLSLDENCFVHLTSVPCKNDPDGSKFAGTPTTCRYHPTATINFARELAAYEVLRGTAAVDRRKTPLLLAPTGHPWRKAALDKFFKALLLLVVNAETAKSYSVHSFRIYLACALHAQGASPERIMMMLRWSSVASLLVYCRPNASTVAGWVESAASASIDAVRANTLANNRAVRPGGSACAPSACASGVGPSAPPPGGAVPSPAAPIPVGPASGPSPNLATPLPVVAISVGDAVVASGSPVLAHSVRSAARADLSGVSAPSGSCAAFSHPRADWLLATSPPPPPGSGLTASNLIHASQFQNIARVVVTDVVAVDDDDVIAALSSSLPAMARAAAKEDAETGEGISASGVYSPNAPEDQVLVVDESDSDEA